MPVPIRVLLIHAFRGATAGLLVGGLLLACSGPAPNDPGTASGPDAGPRVYHVQLQFTDDKDDAAALLGRAQQWWREQPPGEHPSRVEGLRTSDQPVTIVWKAPFYRVRLGPFATETQAKRVLDAARPTFPDAFVALERIEDP